MSHYRIGSRDIGVSGIVKDGKISTANLWFKDYTSGEILSNGLKITVKRTIMQTVRH